MVATVMVAPVVMTMVKAMMVVAEGLLEPVLDHGAGDEAEHRTDGAGAERAAEAALAVGWGRHGAVVRRWHRQHARCLGRGPVRRLRVRRLGVVGHGVRRAAVIGAGEPWLREAGLPRAGLPRCGLT